MNEHTDYKSELATTQELAKQYDSNLQRIISEFEGEKVGIECYEDITNALKNLKNTRYKVAKGVCVSSSSGSPGYVSGGSYWGGARYEISNINVPFKIEGVAANGTLAGEQYISYFDGSMSYFIRKEDGKDKIVSSGGPSIIFFEIVGSGGSPGASWINWVAWGR